MEQIKTYEPKDVTERLLLLHNKNREIFASKSQGVAFSGSGHQSVWIGSGNKKEIFN